MRILISEQAEAVRRPFCVDLGYFMAVKTGGWGKQVCQALTVFYGIQVKLLLPVISKLEADSEHPVLVNAN